MLVIITVMKYQMFQINLLELEIKTCNASNHSVSFFFTPYLSIISPRAGKYGPEKTPYLDTFHAVGISQTFKWLSTKDMEVTQELTDTGRYH